MAYKAKIFLWAAVMAAMMGFWGAAADAAPLVFEVDADKPVLLAGKRQTVTVRALVRPGGAERARRVPLAVALVLDKSGSMASDEKMENAKLGALEALKRMDVRDVAAVVVYDTEASVKVPARSVSDGRAFSKAISSIRPGGNTALYDGVRLGAEQLRPFVKDGYVPRVVLLSDGLANVGPSETADLARFGRDLARQEMTITTIGVGLDYNEDLMTALAAESGGNAYFAKHAGALSDIFGRDMEDAVNLTARKVRVTLTCGAGARAVGSVGRSPLKQDAAGIEVAIDNLYGAEKYALFEIEVPEDAGTLSAATLKLEYLDPDTGDAVTREASLSLIYTEDEREVEKNLRADITAQTELIRNAEVREEAIRLADEGQTDKAARLLRERGQVMQSIAAAPAAAAPAQFESEAKDFEGLAQSLSETGSMNSEQRKETMNKAYIQKNQQSGAEK